MLYSMGGDQPAAPDLAAWQCAALQKRANPARRYLKSPRCLINWHFAHAQNYTGYGTITTTVPATEPLCLCAEELS